MSSCPLSILFDYDATRSLISNPSQLHYLLDTEEGWASFCAFKRIFKQYPDTFLKREHDRRNRCEENGVAYVPPKITDSADATKERIKKLNRAIKSAKQRVRRKEMTEKDRKELSAKRSAARMEKISRESEGDKKQRLKREADWKKNQGDHKFEAQCNMFQAPCPPPRKSNDTATTIRAQRKISRDANRFAFTKKRAPPSGTIFPWDKEWVDDPKRYEGKFINPYNSYKREKWGPYNSYKRCTWRSTLAGETNGKRCTQLSKQGGYCYAHGGLGRTLCGHDDCDNIAQKGGMCRRHGTNLEKCKYDFGYTHSQKGCKFYATKGGMCDVHSRPKCSQEGCKHYALKDLGVCWKHYEEPEVERVQVGLRAWCYRKFDITGKEVLFPIGPFPPFELEQLMQLDQTVRMVDTVPQEGERRVVDSSSSVDAVTNRGWRDDIFAAGGYYEPSKNALLVSDRALFFSPRSKLLTSAPPS
jgi:hypothetical protein